MFVFIRNINLVPFFFFSQLLYIAYDPLKVGKERAFLSHTYNWHRLRILIVCRNVPCQLLSYLSSCFLQSDYVQVIFIETKISVTLQYVSSSLPQPSRDLLATKSPGQPMQRVAACMTICSKRMALDLFCEHFLLIIKLKLYIRKRARGYIARLCFCLDKSALS